jgi:hypothetical protein
MTDMAVASRVHCVVSTRGSLGVPWYATPGKCQLVNIDMRSIRTFNKELLAIAEELGAFCSNRSNSIDRCKSEACERKEREQMHSERFSKFKIDNISHRKNSKNCALIDKETIYQSMLMIEKRRKVNATLEKTFIQSPPALLPSQSLRSTEPHSSD